MAMQETSGGIQLQADPRQTAVVGAFTLPQWRRFWLVLGAVVVLALPFMVEGFTVFQLTLCAVYAIAVLGLNILTGFNGQFSLGHSAFYAIGAYTTGIMYQQWDVMVFWTIIPSFFICFAAGFLFGLPALRLEGLYLALATFALAVATPQFLKYEHFEHFTGGVQGIDVYKPDWLEGDRMPFYITIAITAFMFWLAWNLLNSRSGRAMVAIRDNPLAAKTMGINTALYKSTTFGVSAAFTGVAGSLAAIAIEYIAPDSFTFLLAVTLLVGLVVGGVASIPGAIFGGLFILYIPNWAEEISTGLSWAVYGVFLIIAVYVMPAGFAGLVKMTTARLIKRS